MTTGDEPLSRARCALEGLSIGDAFGDLFFMPMRMTSERIKKRIVPDARWHFSDDTNMALSIFSILRQYGTIDQDRLAESFAKRYEPGRGYGPGMRKLLTRLETGGNWREEAMGLFGGGSFGNGGAMRIAPLGGYFADDLAAVVEQARKATEVTHAHPEGIAGGIAIAVGAAVAYQLRGKTPTRQAFIDQVLPHIPDSEVRSRVQCAREIAENWPSMDGVVAVLGNGSMITAQDTAAFCLWCAGECLNNYEDAVWLTANGGGDVDTNCAIVGGIVAMHTGAEAIPAQWIAYREPLPEWAFTETAQS